MAINSETLHRQLFDLLTTKGYQPQGWSVEEDETVPEESDVIQFDFDLGETKAPVTLSIEKINNKNVLTVYFSDRVSNSPKSSHNTHGPTWEELIKQLRYFSSSHNIGFNLRNRSHLKYDMAKRKYMQDKEKIAEGYYPMGKSASYSDAVPSVKIVIEHTRKIEEGEQRYRNVNRIFLENQAGERFLLDTKKPGIARVYARHIAEGGLVNDERWNHINSLCEEYNKMAGFVRAVRGGQFNESAQKLVNEGVNHYQSLRESLSKMTSHRGYTAYFESWTPALMEDDTDTSALNELFVQETMDPRIESVMPILSRLTKTVSEMKEVDALAEWADSLIEDEGIQSNNPEGIPEGRLDGYAGIDSPVADAITRRILLQRHDLLAKYGPEKVADAIATIADDMGDWIGPDDEIGSSDVSGWVKRVERELGVMSEGEPGDLEHELERQDYERDRERDEQAEKEMGEGLGDVAKKIGGAVKTGAKAVGKAIVGKDDDELLADLKKRAGVRNPGNGKPSMAHSDVEKVDEDGVAEGRDDECRIEWTEAGRTHTSGLLLRHQAVDSARKLKKKPGASNVKIVPYSPVAKEGVAEGEVSKKDIEASKKAIDAKRDKLEKQGVKKSQLGEPSYYLDAELRNAKKKGVAEDLDANQKRVGQLGPTEKVKNNNIGKLVGANENFINMSPQAVAEGQEDLDAILRIIRK